MSEVLSKTFSALPKVLPGLGDETGEGLQKFMRIINSIRSKHDEENFVGQELARLKQKLTQTDFSNAQVRDFLLRLLFCHMLGYDVSFAAIRAINFAQQESLLDKRVGYLVSAMIIEKSDDLVLMMVNTILKDLRSANVLVVNMALVAVTHLVGSELLPAVLPTVEEKLKHSNPLLRQKAVCCLHYCLLRMPHLVPHAEAGLRSALCDPDPSVMWAAVRVYTDVIAMADDASKYAFLIGGVCDALSQVLDRHLPPDYNYHNLPAPWLTISLLRLLRPLIAACVEQSERACGLLKGIMERTDCSQQMGLAVMYECVRTALVLPQDSPILDLAATNIGRFIAGATTGLQFIGLRCLVLLVRIKPSYTTHYQDAILNFLDSNDSTIRQQSLDVLSAIANVSNCGAICIKMLDLLPSIHATAEQAQIAARIFTLADKHMQDTVQYNDVALRTLLAVELPAESVEKIIESVISKLAKGMNIQSVREALYAAHWEMLQRDNLPTQALRLSAWAMGQLHSHVSEPRPSVVIAMLVKWYAKTASETAKMTIVLALTKMAWHVTSVDQIEPLSVRCATHSVALRQATSILLRLALAKTEYKAKVAAMFTQTNTDEVDYSLSFLDEYVAQSLETGAKPYKPKSLRSASHLTSLSASVVKSPSMSLNFAPYDVVSNQLSMNIVPSVMSTSALSPTQLPTSGSDMSMQFEDLRIQPARRVWTKEGLRDNGGDTGDTSGDAGMDKSISDTSLHTSTPRQEPLASSMEREKRRQLASALFSGLDNSSASLNS